MGVGNESCCSDWGVGHAKQHHFRMFTKYHQAPLGLIACIVMTMTFLFPGCHPSKKNYSSVHQQHRTVPWWLQGEGGFQTICLPCDHMSSGHSCKRMQVLIKYKLWTNLNKPIIMTLNTFNKIICIWLRAWCYDLDGILYIYIWLLIIKTYNVFGFWKDEDNPVKYYMQLVSYDFVEFYLTC